MYYNKVILIGNLCRDVERKQLPSGTVLGVGSLAINNKYRDALGNPREEVTFIEFSVFGKVAENAIKHGTKGRNIMVEGRLKWSEWDDKETGKKRQKVTVSAESFLVVVWGDEKSSSSPVQPPQKELFKNTPAGSFLNADEEASNEEDVPF